MYKVSIIIPAFGQINPNSLFLSILGSKKQSCPTEVIVIEEYFNQPKYKMIADELSVQYISYPIHDSFNIGRARNHGISKSTGKYLLMHDADIVLPEPSFIEKATYELINHDNQFLVSPSLQHLQKQEINLWKQNAEQNNNNPFYFLRKCSVYDQFIVTSLPVDENDFVVTSHPYNKLKSDRKYVAIKNLYEKYIQNYESFKGAEPLIFTPCVTKSFVFCSKEQVQAVGLYSEDFFQWGG